LNEDSRVKPNVVFVLGWTGAGKRTICEVAFGQLDSLWLSVGDLLREEWTKGGEKGELIESYIEDGMMVPVEITVKLLLKCYE
jgi:UMP-CMP kinase